MLTRDRVCDLVDMYGTAWANKDVAALYGMFTDDALYIETPSRFFEGVEEIKGYWEKHVVKQENVTFRHIKEDMIFDQESLSATVKWEASFGREFERKGVWCVILRFRPDHNGSEMKICWFEEFWHKIKTEQPEGEQQQQQPQGQWQNNRWGNNNRWNNNNMEGGQRPGPNMPPQQPRVAKIEKTKNAGSAFEQAMARAAAAKKVQKSF